MKKLFLLLTAVLLTAVCALAQTKTVTGTVVSSGDDEPLAGATVLPVGGGQGAATDLDGNFTLTVPAKVTKISVSYVGMMTREVSITSSKMLIKLDPAETSLDEVMVVAYGTAKKSAFTGSATVIKADEIEKAQVTNPLDALSGRVAGVQMSNSSGQPGATTPTIRIRGISSITAGKDPLVIMDGAPFSGDLNTINTSDIASMTILKDAASTALYGARAANGVIIITTKSGQRSSEGRVTVDMKWGSNSRNQQDYNFVKSPAQYYEMYYGALYNYALYANSSTRGDALASYNWANDNLFSKSNGLGYNVYTVPAGQYLIGRNGKLNPNATLGRTVTNEKTGESFYLYPDSWLDAAYKHGLRQEYNVSFQNGNENSSFYGSIGYLKNEGITQNSDFDRLTVRLAAESQIKPWLKVGGNASYAHYSMNQMSNEGEDNSSGNIFAAATQVAPIYPLYLRDSQGNIMVDNNGITRYDYGESEITGIDRPIYSQSNAIGDARYNTTYGSGNAFTGLAFLEIRFLKDFKFTSNNSVGLDETRSNLVSNPYYGPAQDSNGRVAVGHSRSLEYQFQQMLYWNHLFNGVHNVSATLVHENSWIKTTSLSANMTNMFDANNYELANCITNGSATSYTGEYNNEGWLFRGEYDYDSKYFGSFSIRRDGSSYFHPDHRWGTFWTFGAAWLINKESWFNASWVDLLKIKASYGEIGNDAIGSYRYVNTYTIENAQNHPAAVPYTMGNPDITWEKNGNFNAGVEFSFFNERLSGSVEGFYRKTSDMLFSFPLPPTFGYTSYYANIGDMENYGLEVDLNGTVLRSRDFRWDINLNFTWYKNRIKYLPEERKGMTAGGSRGFSSGDFFYGEGESMYTFYIHKYAGVDPETGKALYYTGNDETGEITGTTTKPDDAGFFLCGTALAPIYGGFGTSASYKGFDLSVNFNYQIGGKVYDSAYASLMGNPTSNGRGSNFHADLLNAWTPENRYTDVPIFQYNDEYAAATSDRFLTNASYLSLQNINFGYTLPTKWTRKAYLDKVRVYFTADNLWVWSHRQGLDPRQSISGGSSNTVYSTMRTLAGGINVTF